MMPRRCFSSDPASYREYNGGLVAYGSDFEVVITNNDDGTMTLLDSLIGVWGDSLVDFSGKFDAATSTYTWNAEYVSSMKFHVVLGK